MVRQEGASVCEDNGSPGGIEVGWNGYTQDGKGPFSASTDTRLESTRTWQMSFLTPSGWAPGQPTLHLSWGDSRGRTPA